MLQDNRWYRAIPSVFSILIEVTFFWQYRLYNHFRRPSTKQIYTRTLSSAHSFEEWESAAFQLDEILGNDLWRQNAASKYYDYRLIYERLQAIILTREREDILGLINLLRSGLVRNLGNITAFRLYDRAYAGTKLLIEDYITQVTLAIDAVAAYSLPPQGSQGSQGSQGRVGYGGLSSQSKLDFLHDTRQAFGRTALVLQGGAVFGLCHAGVVKALALRGLLPRIVVGSGAGALVAAVVGVCNEGELLEFWERLGEEDVSLDGSVRRDSEDRRSWLWKYWGRLGRYVSEGYFLDVVVLERCVLDTVGDVTFEEAYSRTRKVLNISIPDDYGNGMPSLFNYLTTPNVLIRSAATASNSTPSTTPPPPILVKTPSSTIEPYLTSSSTSTTTPNSSRPVSSHQDRDTPLTRIAELFNVNHYILSLARPHLLPFLQSRESVSLSTLRHASSRRHGLLLPLLRVFGLEVQHRLRQLDSLGAIPQSVRRFLLDELVPGAHVALVPELGFWDLVGVVWTGLVGWVVGMSKGESKRRREWVRKGERSVWMAVGVLRARLRVENEIERAYQLVRRRKPMDALVGVGYGNGEGMLRGVGEKRKRRKGDGGVG